MRDIRMLLWRSVVPSEFFEVERSASASSPGGGGQSYFSIPFTNFEPEDLGRFLGEPDPTLIAVERPTRQLVDVGTVSAPDARAPLEFAPRYLPPNRDRRYRITRQNRQFQERHPAWTPERGFPAAPDAIERDGPLPDLTYTKIYVLLLDDGTYLAGYFDSPTPPADLPDDPRLRILFRPSSRVNAAGLIEFDPGEISFEAWQRALDPDLGGRPVEVVEALELTRIAAGKRPRGQGFRADPAERRAVELRAMAIATALLEADSWDVDDVSASRSYDLECTRNGEMLHVEVKGTTGDGLSVLLTPGEVRHARDHGAALVVVSNITLERNPQSGEWVGTGGEPAVLNPWDVDADGELIPTGYEYRRR